MGIVDLEPQLQVTDETADSFKTLSNDARHVPSFSSTHTWAEAPTERGVSVTDTALPNDCVQRKEK
jgi:hypothetical protein